VFRNVAAVSSFTEYHRPSASFLRVIIMCFWTLPCRRRRRNIYEFMTYCCARSSPNAFSDEVLLLSVCAYFDADAAAATVCTTV